MRGLTAALALALASTTAAASTRLFLASHSVDTLHDGSTPQPQRLSAVAISAKALTPETRVRLMIAATSGSISTTATSEVSTTTCGDMTSALFMADAALADVESVLQSLWFTLPPTPSSDVRCGERAFQPPRVDLWLETQSDRSRAVSCADLPQSGVYHYSSPGLQHHVKRITVLAGPASVLASTDTLRVRSSEEVLLSGMTLRVPAEDAQCGLLMSHQQRYLLSVSISSGSDGEVALRPSIRSFLSAFMESARVPSAPTQRNDIQVQATSDYIRLALRSLTYKAPSNRTSDEIRIEIRPTGPVPDEDARITRIAVIVARAPVSARVSWNTALTNASQVIGMDEDASLALDGLSVSLPTDDVLQNLIVNVTVAVSHGRFLNHDGGSSSFQQDGVVTRGALDTPAIQASGSLGDINLFLQRLVYIPDHNYNGPDTIVVSVIQNKSDLESTAAIRPSSELLRVFVRPIEDTLVFKWTDTLTDLTDMIIYTGERRSLPPLAIIDGEEIGDAIPFFTYQSFLRAEVETSARSGVGLYHDTLEPTRVFSDGHEMIQLRAEGTAGGLVELLRGVQITPTRRAWSRHAEALVAVRVVRVSAVDGSTSMRVEARLTVTFGDDPMSLLAQLIRQHLVEVREDEGTDLVSVFAWEGVGMSSGDDDIGEPIVWIGASHGRIASNATLLTTVPQTNLSFPARTLGSLKNVLNQLRYFPERDYAGDDELVFSIGGEMTKLWVQVLPENDPPSVAFQRGDNTSYEFPLRTFVPPIIIQDPDLGDLLTLEVMVSHNCSLLLEDSTRVFGAGLQIEALDASSWQLGTPIMTDKLRVRGSQSAINDVFSRAYFIEIIMPDDATEDQATLEVCGFDEGQLKSCTQGSVKLPSTDSLFEFPDQAVLVEFSRNLPVSSLIRVESDALPNETVVSIRLNARLGSFETEKAMGDDLPCGRSIERRPDSEEPKQVYRELTGPWGCMRGLLARTAYHHASIGSAKSTIDEVKFEAWYAARRLVTRTFTLNLSPPTPRYKLSISGVDTANTTTWRLMHERPVPLHQFVEINITPAATSDISSGDDLVDAESRLLVLNVSCSASCLINYDIDSRPAVPRVDYSFAPPQPSHMMDFFGTRQSLTLLLRTLEIRPANPSDTTGRGYVDVHVAEWEDPIYAAVVESAHTEFRFDNSEPPLEWRLIQETYASGLGSDVVSIDGVGLAEAFNPLRQALVALECDSSSPVFITIHHPAVRFVDRPCALVSDEHSIEIGNSIATLNDILRNVQVRRRKVQSTPHLGEIVTIRFLAASSSNASSTTAEVKVQFRPAALENLVPLKQRLTPARNTSLACDEDSSLPLGAIFALGVADHDDSQLYRMTVAVSYGTLEVPLSEICCVHILSHSIASRLVIEGTLAAHRDVLAAVHYKPQAEFSGIDSLQLSIDDEEYHIGAWAYDVSIHVRPVNDAPRIAVHQGHTQAKSKTGAGNDNIMFYQTEISIQLSDVDIVNLLESGDSIDGTSKPDPSVVRVRLVTLSEMASIVLPRWRSRNNSLMAVSYYQGPLPFDSVSHDTYMRSVTFKAPLEIANAILGSVLYISARSGARDLAAMRDEDSDDVDGELLEIHVSDLGHGLTTWEAAEATDRVHIRTGTEKAQPNALVLMLPPDHASLDSARRKLTISGLSIAGLDDGVGDAVNLDQHDDESLVRVTGTAALRVVPEVQRIRLFGPNRIQVLTVVLETSGGFGIASVSGTFELQSTDPVSNQVKTTTLFAQSVAMRIDEVVGNEGTGRGRDESMETNVATLLATSNTKFHIIKTVAASSVTWRIYTAISPTGSLLSPLQAGATALTGVGIGGAVTVSTRSEVFGASLGGFFTLRLGHEATRSIEAGATALEVQDALEELPSVTVVRVTSVAAYTFDVTFFQPGANVPLLEADAKTLTPIATVSDAAWPTITSVGADVQITRVTQGVGQGSVYEIVINGTHVSPVYRVVVSRGLATVSGGLFALSFRSDATGQVVATTEPIAFDSVATLRDEAVLTQEGGRLGNSMESKLRDAIRLLPQRHWSTATRLVVSQTSSGTPPTYTWTITFVDAPSDFPSLIAATSTSQPAQARLAVTVTLLTPANTIGGSFTLSFHGQATQALQVSTSASTLEDELNALDTVRNASTAFGRVVVRRKEIRSVGGASFAVLFVEQMSVSSRATTLLVANGGALTGLGAFARVRAFRDSPWKEGGWLFPGFNSVSALDFSSTWTRGVQFLFEPSYFSLLGTAADVRVWLRQFTYTIPRDWCCGFVSVVVRAQRLAATSGDVDVVRTQEQGLAYQIPSGVAVYSLDIPGLSNDLTVKRGNEQDVGFYRIALPPLARGLLWLRTRIRVAYGTLMIQNRTNRATATSELWLNGSAEAVNSSLAQLQYTAPRFSEYEIDILSVDVFEATNNQLLTRSEFLIRVDEPPFEPRIALANRTDDEAALLANDALLASDDTPLALYGISIVDASVATAMASQSPRSLSDVEVDFRVEARLGQLNFTDTDGLLSMVKEPSGAIALRGSVLALNDALAGLTYSSSRVYSHVRDSVTLRVSYQPDDRALLSHARTLGIDIQHAIHVPRVTIASSSVATYAAKEDNGYQFPNLTVSHSMSKSTIPSAQRGRRVPVTELRRTDLSAPLVTKLPIASSDDDPRHRWLADLPGLSLGPSFGRSFAAFSNGQFFFAGTNRTHGEELWASDGSTNGTQLLVDLLPGVGSSSPSNFAVLPPGNNRVLFAADGIDRSWTLNTQKACNRERPSSTAADLLYVVAASATWDPSASYDCPSVGWRWATTDEGSARFHRDDDYDAITPANLSEPYVFWNTCDWDGFVFGGVTRKHFRFADSASTGALKHAGRRDSAPLEVSFSTADFAGIVCVRDAAAQASAAGRELWISTGSATFGSTKRLSDIDRGPRGSNPQFLTPFQSRWVVFQATTATVGSELFKTDGTAAGTVLVEDIWRGPRSSRPSDFAEWSGGDGRLYFAATTESGRELWSTDGLSSVTVERGRRAAAAGSVLIGTALVQDICASAGSSDPQFLTPLGSVGVFFAATDCVNGRELWVTDGTLAGTKMVKDINSASGQGSDPSHLVAFNGKLYFAATASTAAMGRELFVSDGTAAGTQLLVELVPGAVSAAPTLLTVANARLYFHALDAQGVGSLWVSDGTAGGTTAVWDAPFAQSHILRSASVASPSTSTGLNDKFFVLNNALYYFTERQSVASSSDDEGDADSRDVFQLQISVNRGTVSIPPERPLASRAQVVDGTRVRLEDILRRTLYHPPLNWNVLQSAGDHVVQWNFTVSSTASLATETTIADLIVRPQLDPPVILVPTAVNHATTSAHDFLSHLRLECLPIHVLEDVPTPLSGFSVRGVDDLDSTGMASWELELSVSRGRLSVAGDVAGCVRMVMYGSLFHTKRVRLVASRVTCLSRLLGALTYTSDSHLSGMDTLTIRVRLSVGSGMASVLSTTAAEDVAVVPIVVTEVNDAPYLSPTQSGFFYDAEEDHALVIRDLHVEDPDATALQRVRVDVRVLFGAIALLSRGGSGISIDRSDAAPWAPASSTRLVFSGALEDVNDALASVAYTSAPNWNSLAHADENDGYDVVSITLSDDQAFNASTSARLYVFVSPTPDLVQITPPVVRETSVYVALARDDGALHGDEDEWLETTGLAFTSEDDTTRASLDVTLRVSHGRLAIDEALLRTSGVSTAGSASDGSLWRLRGRFSLVNRSVAALQYLPSRDFYGADALEIVASAIDDYENQWSIETTRVVAITIHAVNDAPQWVFPASRLAWRQDGSTRIAGVELRDVDAASIDCDSLACEWEIVVEVTGSGSLTMPRLDQPPIYASAPNYVALTGSLAELNRALREIVLTTADWDSVVREPVEVWFTADDRGSFGSGGPQVARQQIVVLPFEWTGHALELVAPQDDVLTTDEDTALIFNGSIALRDRDASTRATSVSPQYELTVETGHGRFRLAPSAFSAARLLVVPTATDRVLRVRGFLPQLNAALYGSAYVPDADWFGSERIELQARQLTDGAVQDGGDDVMTATVAVFVVPVCDAPRWRQEGTNESQRDLQANIVLDEDDQVLVTTLAVDDPDVLVRENSDEDDQYGGDFHRELSVAIDVRDAGGVMLATTRGLRITEERAPDAWPPPFAALRLLFFSHVVLTGRATDLNAALHGLIYRPRPDFHTNGHVRDAISLRVYPPSGACPSAREADATTTLRAQIAPVNDAPRVVSTRFQQVTARDVASDVIHRRFTPTQDAFTDLTLPLDAITLEDADIIDTAGSEDESGRIQIPRPETNFRLRVSCRLCSVTTGASLETLQQTHGVFTSQEAPPGVAWGSSSTTYYAPITTLNTVVLASLKFTSARRFAGHAVVLLEVSDLGYFGRPNGKALETAYAMVVRVRRVNAGPQILLPPFGTRAPPLEVDEGASVLLHGAPPLPLPTSSVHDEDAAIPTWQLLLVDARGADSPARVHSLLDVASTVDPRAAVSSLASLSPSQLLFSAFDVSSGSELWTSDGTASGTRLLKDLSQRAFSSSEPRFLTRSSVDGRVYFAARGLDVDAWRLRPELRDSCDGVRESAFAPGVFFVVAQHTTWDVEETYDCPTGLRWMTTAEAARVFVGTEPRDGHAPTEPLVYFDQCGWDAFAWGGQQRSHFRFADSRDTGAFKHVGHRDSYRVDVGFETQEFAGIVCRRLRNDEEQDEEYSAALWSTDGTSEGTHRVTSALSRPAHLTEFQGRLFFQATTPAHGAELWATGGSRSNTQLIADVAFGTRSSAPEQLTVANGKLFFSAETAAAGRELWVSDGNPRREFAQVDHAMTATRLVLDIRSGARSSTPRFLTELPVKGLLLFQADDGVRGAELWASDGSAQGTVLVLDIRSGPRGSEPRFLTLFNNRVFFQADDGVHGAELWVSDGSAAGTQLLSDLVPGARGAAPRYLSVLRLPPSAATDSLVFAAASDRDTSAVEFWTSDGSSAGTQKLFAGSREVVTLNDAAMDDDTRLPDAAKRLLPLGGGFVVVGRKQKMSEKIAENGRVVVSRSLTLVDDDDDETEDGRGERARAYTVTLRSERGGVLRLPHRASCGLKDQPPAQDKAHDVASEVVTLRGPLATLNCLVAQIVYVAPSRSSSNTNVSVLDGWDDAIVATLSQDLETDGQAFTTTQRVRVRVVAHYRPPTVEMPARVFAPLDAWTQLPAIYIRDDDAGTEARLLLRVTVQRGRVRLVDVDAVPGVTVLTSTDRLGGVTLELAASLAQMNAVLYDGRLIEYACLRANACDDQGGGDVVSVTVDDNGFSGRGGALATTQTVPVTLVASS